MSKKDKKIEFFSKVIAIYIGVSYATGFLVWNIYLQSLGFYPNLFQGRFVLTGTLFMLSVILLIGIAVTLEFLFKKIKPFITNRELNLFEKNGDMSRFLRFYLPVVIGAGYLLVFSFFIFPNIDGSVGGGKPKLISIMGDSEEISYLKKFGIKEASQQQTALLCTVYDDDNYIVLVLNDRILSLKKDLYKGFSSLPNKDEDTYVQTCNDTVLSNLLKFRILIKQDMLSK